MQDKIILISKGKGGITSKSFSIILMDKTLENDEMTTDAAKQVIYASKLVDNLGKFIKCKLRNKKDTLGYVSKGIHRSVSDNHKGTVYDNDEVVDYIS